MRLLSIYRLVRYYHQLVICIGDCKSFQTLLFQLVQLNGSQHSDDQQLIRLTGFVSRQTTLLIPSRQVLSSRLVTKLEEAINKSENGRAIHVKKDEVFVKSICSIYTSTDRDKTKIYYSNHVRVRTMPHHWETLGKAKAL